MRMIPEHKLFRTAAVSMDEFRRLVKVDAPEGEDDAVAHRGLRRKTADTPEAAAAERRAARNEAQRA